MGTFEHNARLFDMHCHLDFADDAEAVRRCLETGDAAALCCTVSPLRYVQGTVSFADLATCVVALGLHPWQIAEGTCAEAELVRFTELAPTTRFIGEVGLDYAGDRSEPAAREQQRQALSRVLTACDAPSPFPRKLISVHAVRATADVLDLLEEHDALAHHDCIFHWFSGTSEELKRAIGAGCFFSVGPRMLATKRGREYARIVPTERLLLETDSPSRPGEAWDCATWMTELTETLAALAELRHASEEELAATIALTSDRLLKPA